MPTWCQNAGTELRNLGLERDWRTSSLEIVVAVGYDEGNMMGGNNGQLTEWWDMYCNMIQIF